jgi:hypothetical protein
MAKARSLVFIIGMPITEAATSMSRTAMNARPVSLRIRFFASSAIAATTPRVKRYLRPGVSNGTPRITMFCAVTTPEEL